MPRGDVRSWSLSLTGPPVSRAQTRPGVTQRCPGARQRARSSDEGRRAAMSKRGRKRRSRKGNKANHGKRPNA
ncbi:hypothetical protein SAMN05428965_3427 [Geodermatophilus sp. DSM 45219]|nr:hypothetical protein SAMN05428965_3427 [Geodermatophilus sp. DSM 45219]